MSTAFDPATLAKAVGCITQFTGNNTLDPARPEAQRFINWYRANSKQVDALDGLAAKAGTSHEPLNAFLVEHGFQPLFRPFRGVGAAAVFNLATKWHGAAFGRTLMTRGHHVKAFQVAAGGVDYFGVHGGANRLARIYTEDGGAMWVMMTDQPPTSGMELVETASRTMASKYPTDFDAPIVMPVVGIKQTVSLDWLTGTVVGGAPVDQAFQVLDIRLDETGAYVKAASGIATRGAAPALYIVDKPFVAWRTQPDSETPIAAFYAHEGDWKAA
jgi:hypothetical protein